MSKFTFRLIIIISALVSLFVSLTFNLIVYGRPTYALSQPIISSIYPISATVGSSINLTINGSNFDPTSYVTLYANANSSVTLSSNYISSTQMTAQIPGSNIASTGTYYITVTTSGQISSRAQLDVVSASNTSTTTLLPDYTYDEDGMSFNLSYAADTTNQNNIEITSVSSRSLMDTDLPKDDVAVSGFNLDGSVVLFDNVSQFTGKNNGGDLLFTIPATAKVGPHKVSAKNFTTNKASVNEVWIAISSKNITIAIIDNLDSPLVKKSALPANSLSIPFKLTGFNFTKDAMVNVGKQTSVGISWFKPSVKPNSISSDGTVLDFKLPYNTRTGTYFVTVANPGAIQFTKSGQIGNVVGSNMVSFIVK